MPPTRDEIEYKHLSGCIRAFLLGKKNINWVMAFVRGYRFPKDKLTTIINELHSVSNDARYKELLSACRNENLI